MIKSIDLTLTLRFPDGSICELSDEDAADLEDLTDKRDADCEFKRYDFYPGQILSGQLKDFELANFTFCTEEMKNLRNSSYKSKVNDQFQFVRIFEYFQTILNLFFTI